jgi:hypothetical protein
MQGNGFSRMGSNTSQEKEIRAYVKEWMVPSCVTAS